MPLTPADIHNIEFGKATLGKRGYDEREVDALLDEITEEMIRLLEENDVLHRRLDVGDPAAWPARATGGEFSEAVAELERMSQACDRAEQNARLVRRQLDEAYQRAAQKTPASDESRPDAVLEMAQRTADDYLRQAQDTSGDLLAEAHNRSDRIVHDAQALVGEIEQNAHQRAAEAATGLAAWRADMLRDIDELTRLAEDYQAALERHLLRHGQLLDGTATGKVS
jgi:DivIVA domain-containing protein